MPNPLHILSLLFSKTFDVISLSVYLKTPSNYIQYRWQVFKSCDGVGANLSAFIYFVHHVLFFFFLLWQPWSSYGKFKHPTSLKRISLLSNCCVSGQDAHAQSRLRMRPCIDHSTAGLVNIWNKLKSTFSPLLFYCFMVSSFIAFTVNFMLFYTYLYVMSSTLCQLSAFFNIYH